MTACISLILSPSVPIGHHYWHVFETASDIRTE